MTGNLDLSAAYARLTLQSGLMDKEKLLAGSGLDVDSLAGLDYIDWRALATMFQNLDRTLGSPALAARIGAQFNITAHGPLGFAALSAPTLGDALDVMATLYPARTSALGVKAVHEDGRYAIHLVNLTGDERFHRWISQLVLKVLESLLSAILGHPPGPNVLISLAFPAPVAAEELIAAYDAQVVFDSESYAISIPEAWRHLPSPLRDEAIYRANVIKCREIIATRDQHGSAATVVRNLLSNHFDRIIARDSERQSAPTQEELAASIHLTARTLMRRLQAENTSYKEILEQLRRDYACTLLRDARLNIADVGEIIGYREPANFGRAFRRWFGESPAAWRRH